MDIIRLVFDDENEFIQIFNLEPRWPQINDDTNIENTFYFNLWSHNTKDLMNKKINMQKLHNMFCPPN
jgi:hypothetical protein